MYEIKYVYSQMGSDHPWSPCVFNIWSIPAKVYTLCSNPEFKNVNHFTFTYVLHVRDVYLCNIYIYE